MSLLEARRQRRLTQLEVARLANVSRATLNRLEYGRMLPRLSTVRRLEAVLKTPLRFDLWEEQRQEATQ